MGIQEMDRLGVWRVQRCTASPVNNDGLIRYGLAIPTHIWGNISTANKAQNNQFRLSRKVKSISGARRVVGCVQQGVRGVPSGPAAKPFFNVALSGGGCVYPGLLTQRSSAPEHSRQLSRGVAKWFAGLPVWVAVCRGDAILILAIENIGSLVCA